ncbi:hypothetical protein D9756_005649 [Leucocoprinus leucothites]|uniref:BTB domain-containing protein n=1 Tax=Leucocoprinus leucothites TaxID=201217 RepID=A0A8H5D750_9AGAR|nr:hypothetical protein D9756_005649 [Leucoagaricus leucothites]
MPHNDIEYFVEPLIFRAEDTLFRIPREYLSQESPVFLDMLQLPQPTSSEGGNGGEGSGDATPIVLPDTITANSFRALLKVLCPRNPFNDTILTMEEWLLVLELSRMWDMNRVRTAAIKHLVEDLKDDPAYKWKLAKQYDIQDWIQPALDRLIRRSEPLGIREFQLLDQDTALQAAAIRESCYPIFRDTEDYYDVGGDKIVRWELRPERGQINLDLGSVEFVCPIPPSHDSLDENCTQAESESLRKNGQFFFEKVVFKVEDELYKVPNRPFARHSPAFRRLFSKPGFRKYDIQDPLVIGSSVTKADFEALLSFLFPEPVANPELSSDNWASILRLAARWEMSQVKQLAVERLEDSDFGTISTKLRMAQDLGVQKWYSSAMQTLVTRQEPLGLAECQLLSQDHLLQALDLRERVHSRSRYGYGGFYIHLRTNRGEVPASVDLSSPLASFI